MTVGNHCTGSGFEGAADTAHTCGTSTPQLWHQSATTVGRANAQGRTALSHWVEAKAFLPLQALQAGAEPSGSCIASMPWFTRGSSIGIALALIVQLLDPTPLRAVITGQLEQSTAHSLSHLQ
jgi:hypothetical protein